MSMKKWKSKKNYIIDTDLERMLSETENSKANIDQFIKIKKKITPDELKMMFREDFNQKWDILVNKNNQKIIKFKKEPKNKDMPKKIKVEAPQLKENEFLKQHMQKNGCHEGDREKATSLVKNLVLPVKGSKIDKQIQKNPYFRRQCLKEKHLDIYMQDLIDLSQVAKNPTRGNGNSKNDFYLAHLNEFENSVYQKLTQNSQEIFYKPHFSEQTESPRVDFVKNKYEISRNSIPLSHYKKLLYTTDMNTCKKQMEFALSSKNMTDVIQEQIIANQPKKQEKKQVKKNKLLDESLSIQNLSDRRFLNLIEQKYIISKNDISPFCKYQPMGQAEQRVNLSSSLNFKISQQELQRAGLDDTLDLSAQNLRKSVGKLLNNKKPDEKELEILLKQENFDEREPFKISDYMIESKKSFQNLKKNQSRNFQSKTQMNQQISKMSNNRNIQSKTAMNFEFPELQFHKNQSQIQLEDNSDISIIQSRKIKKYDRTGEYSIDQIRVETDSVELSSKFDELSRIQKKTKTNKFNSRSLIKQCSKMLNSQQKLSTQVDKLIQDTHKEQDSLKEQVMELKKQQWARVTQKIIKVQKPLEIPQLRKQKLYTTGMDNQSKVWCSNFMIQVDSELQKLNEKALQKKNQQNEYD